MLLRSPAPGIRIGAHTPPALETCRRPDLRGLVVLRHRGTCGGSTTHGCLEEVKICMSGGMRSGSSRVPMRTNRMASPRPHNCSTGRRGMRGHREIFCPLPLELGVRTASTSPCENRDSIRLDHGIQRKCRAQSRAGTSGNGSSARSWAAPPFDSARIGTCSPHRPLLRCGSRLLQKNAPVGLAAVMPLPVPGLKRARAADPSHRDPRRR